MKANLVIIVSGFSLMCSLLNSSSITISAAPSDLIISTATAGLDPDSVSDSTTTYSITTENTNAKITGDISAAPPNSTKLKVNLAAPTGATSAGSLELTVSPTTVDLVTGIDPNTYNNLQITYTLEALVGDGSYTSAARTVTLTLVDNG